MVAYAPLIIEGFDHFAAATDLSLKHTGAITSGGGTLPAGRLGGLCYQQQGGNAGMAMLLDPDDVSTAYDHVLISGAFKFNTLAQACFGLQNLAGPNASTARFNVILDGSNHLVLRRGSTVIATSTTTLSTGVWHWLEIKLLLATTAVGSTEVYINGVLESAMTTSGVITINTATPVAFVAWANSGGNWIQIDDLIIQDWSVAGVGYLGDSRVATLWPTADGHYTDFAPLSGTNVSNVDETAADDDTTYNSSATPGDRDSFTHGALPTAGTPFAIQITAEMRKDDAGARVGRIFLRDQAGGLGDHDSGDKTLLTSYTMPRKQWATDPLAGGLWDQAAVESYEIGYKVES